MTENSGSDNHQIPDEMVDRIGDALGTSQSGRRKSGISRNVRRNITGDDKVEFDLTDCEIVAQAFDNVSGVGTRLYHVDSDIYALSQFRRAVSQDWNETLQTHGPLIVDPVKLEQEPLDAAIEDHGADSLDNFSYIQSVYADSCEQAIWYHLEADRTEGVVPRGQIVCIEDHGWRSTLRPALTEQLTVSQTEAVLDGLMTARPDVGWTWCQLYAVYIATLRFEASTSPI